MWWARIFPEFTEQKGRDSTISMCQLSASEKFNALGLTSGKCGNLDSLFPGDSTGALFQGVSAPCAGPWGAVPNRQVTAWSDIWHSNGIYLLVPTQMLLRCVKVHTRWSQFSAGFGIRMSQLDARMCKITSQTAPCWLQIWGSSYAPFIPANAWNILCLLNVFPKC